MSCCDDNSKTNSGSCCAQPAANEPCCSGEQQTSCCAPAPEIPASACATTAEEITEMVRAGYADVSVKSATRTAEEVKAAHELAQKMGYSEEELSHIPEESNMGLQCGNCVSIANLQPGETVVDLGSGGGFDIFLAARRVGETGKAIGIDMTEEMVNKARATAEKRGFKNTEFHLANITKMPLPDNSVDVIISNCVINLAPSKTEVFKEMFRILKPGGRVAVSDVVLTDKELPPSARKSINLLVGCVAGAIPSSQYLQGLTDAGFSDAKLVDGGQDLNKMWHPEAQTPDNGNTNVAGCGEGSSSCCSTTCCAVGINDVDEDEIKGLNINDFVFSGKVTAVKK